MQPGWKHVSPPPPVDEPVGYEPLDAPGHHVARGSVPLLDVSHNVQHAYLVTMLGGRCRCLSD